LRSRICNKMWKQNPLAPWGKRGDSTDFGELSRAELATRLSSPKSEVRKAEKGKRCKPNAPSPQPSPRWGEGDRFAVPHRLFFTGEASDKITPEAPIVR
jgi:hypothetical protein